ncbi:metal-dependent hydrolase family protein [Thalassiella azotivora]
MTRTVFSGGLVFDGTTTGEADVAVEGGRVVDVGRGLDGDDVVDCTGRTVLPGLVDCHVHVMISGVDVLRSLQTPFSYPFYEAARNLRSTLACGITTVRDAGGADLGVKKAVDDGLVVGPRMQVSISILSQTGGHGDDWMPCGSDVPWLIPHPGRPSGVVDGVEEMRKAARTLLRAGADVLKVCTTGGVLSAADDPRHAQFTPAELDVLVAEASAQERPVMAHAQGAQGIKNAVRAGVRSIEHGIYLDDEGIELMLERGTWLVPTLVAPRAVQAAAAAGAAIPEVMVAKSLAVTEVHTEAVTRAVEAGVPIAMGTDAGVGPHGTNLDELPLMAACGMGPEQVLAASTSQAARLVGLADEVGRLAPGLRADVVVVDGDARDLDDLRSRVREVWKDGERVVTG